ncbi:hypothetical protein IW262DRAFT_1464809 [Armillaria fumosa]|nr:hypothetical protein IW262DRAFT_1464809 [Armillaria fumosa]
MQPSAEMNSPFLLLHEASFRLLNCHISPESLVPPCHTSNFSLMRQYYWNVDLPRDASRDVIHSIRKLGYRGIIAVVSLCFWVASLLSGGLSPICFPSNVIPIHLGWSVCALRRFVSFDHYQTRYVSLEDAALARRPFSSRVVFATKCWTIFPCFVQAPPQPHCRNLGCIPSAASHHFWEVKLLSSWSPDRGTRRPSLIFTSEAVDRTSKSAPRRLLFFHIIWCSPVTAKHHVRISYKAKEFTPHCDMDIHIDNVILILHLATHVAVYSLYESSAFSNSPMAKVSLSTIKR